MTARGRRIDNVSTHSRPKAAGTGFSHRDFALHSFNTQPPEGGWFFVRS